MPPPRARRPSSRREASAVRRSTSGQQDPAEAAAIAEPGVAEASESVPAKPGLLESAHKSAIGKQAHNRRRSALCSISAQASLTSPLFRAQNERHAAGLAAVGPASG